MPITYRALTADEFDQFDSAVVRGFLGHPDPNPIFKDFARRVFVPERSLVAFDGNTIVGTTSSIAFDMTVPEQRSLPVGGVTEVTVSQTHTRRGILTGMMKRQLESLHEREEPLAALWASESVIYGRFGFGQAVTHEFREIDRRYTAFSSAPEIRGQMHFVEKDGAQQAFAPIFDRVAGRYPGMLRRSDLAWEAAITDFDGLWTKSPDLFYAYYEVDGDRTGYLMYRIRHSVTDGHADNKVEIRELVAVDDEATAALWRFCFDTDLASTITVSHGAPTDDGLGWMLADQRRLKRSAYDGLWLRIVDVPTALAARSYGAEDSLAIQVNDPVCPWNDGVWRIEGGPEGGRCEPTNGEADISLSASDLGAIYLGGTRPSEIARSGRIEGNTPGALVRADRMFASERKPWNLVDF